MLWNLQELKRWAQPSMLQHWFIARTVDGLFAPIRASAEVVKEYWDTWHQVYREPRK